MPGKYTDEFKGDVVAMVREGGVTQRESAKDFGISKSALAVWSQKAERDELRVVGASSGRTADDAALLREALKWNRLLEQEAEAMRRAVAYLSQATLPK